MLIYCDISFCLFLGKLYFGDNIYGNRLVPLGYGGAGGGKFHLQSRHVDIDGRIFANGMAPDSRADMAAGMLFINPFMLNGISHCYQDQFISLLIVVGWYYLFLIAFHKTFCKQNSGDTDQTSHTAASDLGLHCLPMFPKKDTRII